MHVTNSETRLPFGDGLSVIVFGPLIVIPAPRLRGGKLLESTQVNKMDTRLRGYDTLKNENVC